MHPWRTLGSLLGLGLAVACGSGGGEDLFSSPGAAGSAGGSEQGGESSEGGGGDANLSGTSGDGGGGGESAGDGGAAGDGGSAGESAGGEAGAAGDAGAGGEGGAPAVCGDGALDAGEQCDDGNADDGDGCAQCKVVCPAVQGVQLNEANGHCYWMLQGGVFGASWLEQYKKCAAQGGYMASIRSPQENDFVKALHKGDAWIGATDGRPVNEPGVGVYFWISKEPFDFSSWSQGEPNAFAFGCPPVVATCYEHCASQRADGLWNDKNCNENSEAVCEWTPPGVP